MAIHDSSHAQSSTKGTSTSMTARLARRITSGRSEAYPLELEPLIARHRSFHPKAIISPIVSAYKIAENYHRGVVRKSGEHYITHPLAVAMICAELGMDSTTLAAAILHDTVEDTDYTLEQLEKDFGPVVAHLVNGVTKLDSVALGEFAEAETIRKMVIAMAEDPRVLVIKVADRLHNMRTMKFLAHEKQVRKATQTLEVIAPLAHRLGLTTVKCELEELAFEILHPHKFQEIARLVADRAPRRDKYIRDVISAIQSELDEVRMDAVVAGRPKQYWSIYQKMVTRGKEFDEIHDLIGVRILCNTENECYTAIGVVHNLWSPIPGTFKDYLANARYGLYRSLHTSVVGPGGKSLEVQVRTHEMHATAEYGIAAHWRYKETRGTLKTKNDDVDDMAWMRKLLQWQREAADPNEFLDSLRWEVSAKEIFVFTPKGDILTLPAGSTIVDFAYSVHTEVGDRCIGAKVDGKLVSLERQLANGESVEVFTSKDEKAGPSLDWQDFVKTPRARAKIRQWHAKEDREEVRELGRELISTEMRRLDSAIRKLVNVEDLTLLAYELGYQDVTAMYEAVGTSNLKPSLVIDRLRAMLEGNNSARKEELRRALYKSAVQLTAPPECAVIVADDLGEVSALAGCCNPIPGDDIVGILKKSGNISVHRTACLDGSSVMEDNSRLVETRWDTTVDSQFLVVIQVEAFNRRGLLSDITQVLAETGVDILSANVSTGKEYEALSRYGFEMSNPTHLDHVLRVVGEVEGVYKVYRSLG